ncbi:MAG: bifunctional oligoribonuclease/PAP phosphatase NrnA [Paludibacteraceae bacterium]
MLSKIISEENVKEAYSLIKHAENVVIVSHMGPDGDAVGSSLGMYHFLKEINKKATVVLPNDFPAYFKWMPDSDAIVIAEDGLDKAVQILKYCDLLIMIDFNELGRVNVLKPLIEVSNVPKLLIDHHLDPDVNMADVVISHPDISSASELVFRLICRMGFAQQINKSCAESIYTGMMTDTGGFTYNSNQSEIYFIIAELVRKGIDKDLIYRKINFSHTESRLRIMGFCMYKKMRIYPKYHTAVITLTEEEMSRFQTQTGDTEGVVNLPFSIKGIVFSAFFREDKKHGKIKISFRSQGSFPANRVASEHFNGGGHLNAAGGDTRLSLRDTVKRFMEVLPEYEQLLNEVKI